MYRAKRGGADRIEIFRPEMRADRDDRVALESDLRKALAKNQIKVLYQPIIYLPTEELAGFEALVRWEHPKRGLMSPDDFIPIAEQSDLIVRLGSHVLLRAAHEAARWQRELPREERPLFVSVNISSRQIFRQNLIQEIRHILGRNIVPKGSLRLEITESLVMENPEQATEILEWLRGAGAQLALDDFGTGYSSLAYLQRFPFDTIKIDRALVQASGDSGGAGSAIVRSIVALGHELGKSVVAEGVETRGGRRLPALDQLPVRAGLLLRRADVGPRRAAASEDGAHGRAQAAPARTFPRQGQGQAAREEAGRDRREDQRRDAASPHDGERRPPAPPSTLPNSTLRPRPRPSAPAAVNGMATAQPGRRLRRRRRCITTSDLRDELGMQAAATAAAMPPDFAAPGPRAASADASGAGRRVLGLAAPHASVCAATAATASSRRRPQHHVAAMARRRRASSDAGSAAAVADGPIQPAAAAGALRSGAGVRACLPRTPETARIRRSTASTIPWRRWASTPCSPYRRGMANRSEPNPLLAALQNEAAAPPEPLRRSRLMRRCRRHAAALRTARPLPPRPRRRPRAAMPAPTVARRHGAQAGAAPRRRTSPACRRRWPRALAKLAGVPWPPRPDDDERRASGAGVRSAARYAAREIRAEPAHAVRRGRRRSRDAKDRCRSWRARASYFASRSGSKIRSGSAGQLSQPLAWISLSSWPGDQPA